MADYKEMVDKLVNRRFSEQSIRRTVGAAKCGQKEAKYQSAKQKADAARRERDTARKSVSTSRKNLLAQVTANEKEQLAAVRADAKTARDQINKGSVCEVSKVSKTTGKKVSKKVSKKTGKKATKQGKTTKAATSKKISKASSEANEPKASRTKKSEKLEVPYTKEALKLGTQIEQAEHKIHHRTAAKIAKDHLMKDPHYYDGKPPVPSSKASKSDQSVSKEDLAALGEIIRKDLPGAVRQIRKENKDEVQTAGMRRSSRRR